MSFAVFARTHYPLKTSGKPRAKLKTFDITKDLKPGDIVYYLSNANDPNSTKHFGKFIQYDSLYHPDQSEVWAMWPTSRGGVRKAYCHVSKVHLHTGKVPADLLNV